MNKWTLGAKKRRAVIDAEAGKASDLDIIVTEIKKLPPGQLKKVLTEDILAILEKYLQK